MRRQNKATRLVLMALSTAAVAAVAAGNARAQQTTDLWSLTPEQRQQILEEQRRQLELNQELQAQLELQVQQAQQQEALAMQQAAEAQMEAAQAQARAMKEVQQATKAALDKGFATGDVENRQQNLSKRSDMVSDALQSWQPPKRYTAGRAAAVRLEDPFVAARKDDPASEPMDETLRGTCLVLDAAHGVARVGQSCPRSDCWERVPAGSYPVTEDSNLLDTAERVGEFLAACTDPKRELLVFDDDMTLLRIPPRN